MRPYLVFSFFFVIANIALSFIAGLPEAEWQRTTLALIAPLIAAAIAVLVAQRTGNLAFMPLLAIGVALTAAIYLATWSVYHYEAIKAGGAVPFWRLVQIGGWSYLLGCLAHAVAPVVGRLLVPQAGAPIGSGR